MSSIGNGIDVAHWPEFEQAFNDELLPRLAASDVAAILWSGKTDAKISVEIGLAVTLDKPIIVIAYKGARVPTKLFDVSTEVVKCDTDIADPEFQERLRAAVERA